MMLPRPGFIQNPCAGLVPNFLPRLCRAGLPRLCRTLVPVMPFDALVPDPCAASLDDAYDNVAMQENTRK